MANDTKWLDGRRPSLTGRDFDTEWAQMKAFIQEKLPNWKDFSDSNPLARQLKSVAAVGENIHFSADSLFLEQFLETLIEEKSLYRLAALYNVDLPLQTSASNTVALVFEDHPQMTIPAYSSISFKVLGRATTYTAYTFEDYSIQDTEGVVVGDISVPFNMEFFEGEIVSNDGGVTVGTALTPTVFNFTRDIDERSLRVYASPLGTIDNPIELERVAIEDFDFYGREGTKYCVVKKDDHIELNFCKDWWETIEMSTSTFRLDIIAVKPSGELGNIATADIDGAITFSINSAANELVSLSAKPLFPFFSGGSGGLDLTELKALVPRLFSAMNGLNKLADYETFLKSKPNIATAVALDSTLDINSGAITIGAEVQFNQNTTRGATVLFAGSGASVAVYIEHKDEDGVTLVTEAFNGVVSMHLKIGDDGKLLVSYLGTDASVDKYPKVMTAEGGGEAERVFIVVDGVIVATAMAKGDTLNPTLFNVVLAVGIGTRYEDLLNNPDLVYARGSMLFDNGDIVGKSFGVFNGEVWLLAIPKQVLYTGLTYPPYNFTAMAGNNLRELVDEAQSLAGLETEVKGVELYPDPQSLGRSLTEFPYKRVLKEFAVKLSALSRVSGSLFGADEVLNAIESEYSLENKGLIESVNYLELYKIVSDYCTANSWLLPEFKICEIELTDKKLPDDLYFTRTSSGSEIYLDGISATYADGVLDYIIETGTIAFLKQGDKSSAFGAYVKSDNTDMLVLVNGGEGGVHTYSYKNSDGVEVESGVFSLSVGDYTTWDSGNIYSNFVHKRKQRAVYSADGVSYEDAWQAEDIVGSKVDVMIFNRALSKIISNNNDFYPAPTVTVWNPNGGTLAVVEGSNVSYYVNEPYTVKVASGSNTRALTANFSVYKERDAQYIYTFKGWSPLPAEVFIQTLYTAEWETTLRQYTITFKQLGITESLEVQVLDYGSSIAYGNGGGVTPAKPDDENFTYTFNGWSPIEADNLVGEQILPEVSEDKTYYAQFTATQKE